MENGSGWLAGGRPFSITKMFYGNFAPLLSSAGLPDGFIFLPKIPVWVCFGWPSDEKLWYFLWT
jgi:hypothetical protein